MSDQVGILGAGAWGTTLAVLLADAQRPVSLWTRSTETAERLAHARMNERYLPGVVFPPNLRVVTDDAYLGEPHRFYVVAVPSEHLRATLRELAPRLHPGVAILSVVKGIEEGSHLRMSEVVAQELPDRRVAVLSGPNLAREIAGGKPAGSVIASPDPELAAELAGVLSSDRFRVYTNPDVVGVELGGALKNVIALAAGMVDGLGFGDSAKAGIITRGLAEITRLGVAAGAHPLTFAGLAGVGDLIATCMSSLSRNRRAGELIASGVPWPEAGERLAGVAEGIPTLVGALELAAAHGVELPIAEQVWAVVFERRPPLEAVAALMARSQKSELERLDPPNV
jgi:glycerol-3-phosphate dehydrogenase (NAD(P)+)